jgi:2-polyprenyl-3-methyl-5-hydroxy-6-metoxy-1,4-benzoquinol methylase
MPSLSLPDRLRASPSFALTFTMDGRPFVAKETEPYIQYWMTERDRVLLSIFSAQKGSTQDEAIGSYWRWSNTSPSPPEQKRLLKSIQEMREAGVLIGARDDVSRYTNRIADAYVAHRPFPPELAELIIRQGSVTASTPVLDLAGGPGDLALALAQVSDQVSLMELSKGFINAASKRAKQRAVKLRTLHDSCNRLIYDDGEYDVVTISQALHWLDDVLVCRGLCRCLRSGGSFFVIMGAFSVEDQHPLSYILGDRSILGHKSKTSFVAQVQALQKRLTLLFDALDAPAVHRVDHAQRLNGADHLSPSRIVPATVSVFRQKRPMGLGFSRAFLTPSHISVTGQPEDIFWKDLENRCADATPQQLEGRYDWAVLQFRRGGPAAMPFSPERCQVIEIGYPDRIRY